MTTESLHTIIAAENELLAREEEERAVAETWRAQQEAELRAEFGRQHEALAAATEAARLQARENAERKAAGTVRAAGERGRRLASVSDEVLRRILARHLVALVGGKLP